MRPAELTAEARGLLIAHTDAQGRVPGWWLREADRPDLEERLPESKTELFAMRSTG
jgi:hypothetical protein